MIRLLFWNWTIGEGEVTSYVVFGDAREIGTPMLTVSLGPNLECADVATPLIAEAIEPRTDV